MLTEAQKSKIRLYLGYPNIFRYLNYRLEGAIQTVSDQDPYVEVQILEVLQEIDIVEKRILQLIPVAGIKKADEVEFFPNRTLQEIRSWGKMYVTRLSILLGVPIYSDVFGTKGYLGDKFSAGGLANGRAGNKIPLG